jgi:hypothetical protein
LTEPNGHPIKLFFHIFGMEVECAAEIHEDTKSTEFGRIRVALDDMMFWQSATTH